MTTTFRDSSADHTATHKEAQSLCVEEASEPVAPPAASLPTEDNTPAPDAAAPVPRKSCSELLSAHFRWTGRGSLRTNQESPLVQYLYDNRELPLGWLRQEEALRAGLPKVVNIRSNMSQRETQIAFSLRCALASTPCLDQNTMAPMKNFAHAWGRNKKAFSKMLNNVIAQDNFLCEKKPRSSKGKCIITSTMLQKREFTPFNYYKKVMCRQTRQSLESRTAAVMKREFDLLDAKERRFYELGAEAELKRAQHLPEEIEDALRKHNGCITWKGLELYLSNNGIPIVSKDALRRHRKGKKLIK